MIIQNTPMIRTIPDDTMLFSILNPKSKMAKKIIMENYINFYSVVHPFVGDVIFRFENLIDYESICGLKRLFIPFDYIKNISQTFDTFFAILKDGFYINMPVSKKAIAFYHCEENVHHHMLIYGYDDITKEFLCMDFWNTEFVKFRTSFESLKTSSDLYYNPGSTESNGILAYKIETDILEEIQYSKVYMELIKLAKGRADEIKGFGLGAIDLFLKDIDKSNINERFFFRWNETANYLREAAKLMQYRYATILYDLQIEQTALGNQTLEKLRSSTDLLFYKTMKASLSRSMNPSHKVVFRNLCVDCRKAFSETIDLFLGMIIPNLLE